MLKNTKCGSFFTRDMRLPISGIDPTQVVFCDTQLFTLFAVLEETFVNADVPIALGDIPVVPTPLVVAMLGAHRSVDVTALLHSASMADFYAAAHPLDYFGFVGLDDAFTHRARTCPDHELLELLRFAEPLWLLGACGKGLHGRTECTMDIVLPLAERAIVDVLNGPVVKNTWVQLPFSLTHALGRDYEYLAHDFPCPHAVVAGGWLERTCRAMVLQGLGVAGVASPLPCLPTSDLDVFVATPLTPHMVSHVCDGWEGYAITEDDDHTGVVSIYRPGLPRLVQLIYAPTAAHPRLLVDSFDMAHVQAFGCLTAPDEPVQCTLQALRAWETGQSELFQYSTRSDFRIVAAQRCGYKLTNCPPASEDMDYAFETTFLAKMENMSAVQRACFLGESRSLPASNIRPVTEVEYERVSMPCQGVVPVFSGYQLATDCVPLLLRQLCRRSQALMNALRSDGSHVQHATYLDNVYVSTEGNLHTADRSLFVAVADMEATAASEATAVVVPFIRVPPCFLLEHGSLVPRALQSHATRYVNVTLHWRVFAYDGRNLYPIIEDVTISSR
jgi:hypothetical protein